MNLLPVSFSTASARRLSRCAKQGWRFKSDCRESSWNEVSPSEREAALRPPSYLALTSGTLAVLTRTPPQFWRCDKLCCEAHPRAGLAACEHACSPQHVPCGLSVRSFPSWCRSHLQRTCQRSTARLARCRCSAADGAQREHSERLWLELSCGCALAQRECGSRASMRTYHRHLLQLLRRVRGAVRLSRPVLTAPVRSLPLPQAPPAVLALVYAATACGKKRLSLRSRLGPSSLRCAVLRARHVPQTGVVTEN